VAGAVRLCVWRANAWRACGVEGGGFHRQIFLGCKALSRDRLCPLTAPISPWASLSVIYIDQFSTLHQMNNKCQVDNQSGEHFNVQRGCVSVFPGAPLARSSHLPSSPRWGLRGDTRCVSVATKSLRSIRETLAGGTADDRR